VDEVGGVKRKDVQRLAAELVDGIEQMRRDLALRDAQVQQLIAQRNELWAELRAERDAKRPRKLSVWGFFSLTEARQEAVREWLTANAIDWKNTTEVRWDDDHIEFDYIEGLGSGAPIDELAYRTKTVPHVVKSEELL
jgi:hypothetical protein